MHSRFLQKLSLLFFLSFYCSSCVKQFPEQIKLEKAEILPLSLDEHFFFYRPQIFLNDPKTYDPNEKFNATIDFERSYYMWPATTELEKNRLYGEYFNFYWKNSGVPSDITVRLDYCQENLGSLIIARAKTYYHFNGYMRTVFKINGDDYLENGRVTSWRCILIVNSKIVGLTQSFLWK